MKLKRNIEKNKGKKETFPYLFTKEVKYSKYLSRSHKSSECSNKYNIIIGEKTCLEVKIRSPLMVDI